MHRFGSRLFATIIDFPCVVEDTPCSKAGASCERVHYSVLTHSPCVSTPPQGGPDCPRTFKEVNN